MDQEGTVLREAMEAGALPKLEKLEVIFDEGGGEVAVMAGLDAGGCPHLKENGYTGRSSSRPCPGIRQAQLPPDPESLQ